MVQEVFLYISLIVGLSALLTVLARFIKQPPIIAYLFAGVLSGPLFFNLVGGDYSELITLFSHMGVAFLLFIVGLNLDLKILKEIGKVSTIAGFAEIVVTGGVGFLIAIGLGFSNITALYIGAALSFSSTVVVVKILSDKKEIDTLHGRIAVGILIVEDFVAALALMILPLVNGQMTLYSIIIKVALAIGLIIAILLFAEFILKKFMSYLARSQETLFLFGIAWALLLAMIFNKLGLSLEIGALIAGISLASSKYSLDLGGKMKPLRDFFVILFFVFFGSQLATKVTWHTLSIAIILSLFVTIGKPIIVMTILRIFGYKKRTNFLAGSSIAQISEFSLILILLGYNLGYLTQDIMGLAVLIAIITIGLSSYSIYYSHMIFNKIAHLLNIFEGKKFKNLNKKEETYEVILFGYHRMGYKMISALKSMNKKFVVIDYNPKTILALLKEKTNAIYGDAGDKNFLSELPLRKAKLVISTIPEEYSNLMIKDMIKETGSEATFIATSEQPRNALDLYKEGIDYVLIPHHLGGEYAAHLIAKHKLNKEDYKKIGIEHKKQLEKGKNNSAFN